MGEASNSEANSNLLHSIWPAEMDKVDCKRLKIKCQYRKKKGLAKQTLTFSHVDSTHLSAESTPAYHCGTSDLRRCHLLIEVKECPAHPRLTLTGAAGPC